MLDPLSTLARLRRPTILIQTARLGAEDYRRDVHLARLLGHPAALPRNSVALMRLIETEA
jgi:hypothetical protein